MNHRILITVAEVFGVSIEELTGPQRTQHIVRARCAAMLLLYEQEHWSMEAIGKVFGRDHSTVVFNVRKARHNRTHDQRFSYAIQRVLAIVAPPAPPAPDPERSRQPLDHAAVWWHILNYEYFAESA